MPSEEWVPPAAFEEYRLVRPIGRGAMGQVHLAHDTLLDRAVAVKFLARMDAADGARERLFREARAIARLSHPNVVAVHRVGEIRGRPYLISEFVRGRSLDQIDKPIGWQRSLEIGIGLARGLAAAHRRGVLHRDIKPANAIVSDDGEVKLLDFGLAKLMDREPARPKVAELAYRGPRTAEDRSWLRAGRRDEAAAFDPLATVDQPGDASAPGPEAAPPPEMATQREEAGDPARGPQGDGSAALTQTGATIGSPLYMAPEMWRGEPATPRADVYSLGVLLYELCAGRAPHHGRTALELRCAALETDATPLAEAAPGVDARLAAIVDRCLARDPAHRYEAGDALREALEQLAAPALRGALPEGNPYRGLHAFQAEHRDLFFGRGTEVRAILDRMRAEPFVLVAGDSGVGKSSLCRAGVLPAVEDGALAGGAAWSIVRLVPGRHPVASLIAALAPAAELATAPMEPVELARELLRQREGSRTLIFVDQLEELLTLADVDEGVLAAQLLGALVFGARGVLLLATARSDFLTRLAGLPGLGADVPRALHLLRPLSADGMREAIVAPSRAKGIHFESDALVDELVEAACHTEGGLPLLQFALAELWDARDQANRVIPAQALAAISGVGGALARHADAVVEHLLSAERAAARSILGRLVTAEGTRARRSSAEIVAPGDSAARAALEALVRGRLVVAHAADEGADGGSYELSHEVLLSSWGTLRGWLAGDAEARATRQRIERAAAEWERLGRAPEAAWSERQLVEAGAVAEGDLLPGQRAFLEASRRAVRSRRRRRLALAVVAPLLAALVYGGIELNGRRELDRQVAAQVSEGRSKWEGARAKSAELDALRAKAFALFDAGEEPARQAAEEVWARALDLGLAADAEYSHASRALEGALSLDPARAAVRSLLADVTYERATLAQRSGRAALRDEVLERLSLHDASGDRRRRFDAPARLTVTISPPAEVALLRFEERGGHFELEPARRLGTTPLADLTLEQGSWVLVFTGSGRATARLPVLVGRDEELRIEIELPSAADVPDGFLYVPAGRFLFGSGDDEDVRRGFYGTVPLHEVHTGAYLVGRTEVTFGEWIAFLRDLPAEERARRTPRTRVLERNVGLFEEPDGRFRYTTQPTSQVYTALEGEMIRYPERDRRALQDWRRFPVSAISFDDALAFTAWLDAGGQVPGARLCTEHEWERAARGADGRRFSGGSHLMPDDANHDATYGRRPLAFGPDEVGSHPGSRSPVGADDMVGNVWEWTRAPTKTGEPVTKGGDWYRGELTNRTMNREISEASERSPMVGLRVCATPRRR